MVIRSDAAQANPIIAMNTTPLIDVMLVLLVMFIITIPIQTHAVKVDLPVCNNCPQPNVTKNEIVITRTGAILWAALTLAKMACATNSRSPKGCVQRPSFTFVRLRTHAMRLSTACWPTSSVRKSISSASSATTLTGTGNGGVGTGAPGSAMPLLGQ
jgi:hypothetical protein